MLYRLGLLTVGFLLAACGGAPSGSQSAEGENMNIMPEDIVDENLNITLEPPAISAMNKTVPGFTRGINLGNGFDAPSIGEWGVILEENHFKYVSEAGLDHVRLPVRFSAYASHEAPYTIDEEFFKKVDWALDMAAKYNLSIIVDLHHYEEIMKDPDAHMDRFLGLWKQIAERYKDRPETVAFELMNEPCENLKIEKLNPLMKQAFNIVRETNPTRWVLINPYFWASTEWLDKMDVSFVDDKTIITFHMYQPILFTHQGAPWMPPEFHTRGIVFPGPPKTPVEITGAAETTDWVYGWLLQYNNTPTLENPSGPKTVWEEFDRVTAFIEKTGLPTYLGEFSAMDFADARSREIFIKLVRKESERRGIGWAYWDDGGHCKGIDVKTGQWTDVVKNSLFDQ
ncbi:MAG: cellulase family glycosylhydrolase [Deltaproteobacteria bacterium]|nr:cellulase family glycosylhydrolase [Deltaproteobacteria bacterium]MBN2671497.1 cellulase family glycosylhydrolase [Deltaproteobacteria bacterium]